MTSAEGLVIVLALRISSDIFTATTLSQSDDLPAELLPCSARIALAFMYWSGNPSASRSTPKRNCKVSTPAILDDKKKFADHNVNVYGAAAFIGRGGDSADAGCAGKDGV